MSIALNGNNRSEEAFEERRRELTRLAVKVKAFREAGEVRRAHCLPHFGTYDVAQHSYNAASLLLVLNPEASLSLVKAMLWHDSAERWVGDTPSPALASSKALKLAYCELEARILASLGVPAISDEELRWMIACDKLECLLWAREQVSIGNQHAEPFVWNVRDWFVNNRDNVPGLAYDYLAHVLEKQPLCFRLTDNPESIINGVNA